MYSTVCIVNFKECRIGGFHSDFIVHNIFTLKFSFIRIHFIKLKNTIAKHSIGSIKSP